MELNSEIIVKEELDSEYLCRACLSTEDNLRAISEDDEDYEQFLNVFKSCTSVDLKEITEIPLRICENCILRVNELNTFREMCIQSHSSLKNVLITPNSVLSIEEDDSFKNNVNVDSYKVKPIRKKRGRPSSIKSVNGEFRCEICWGTFEDSLDLKKHSETVHCTNDYCCSLCIESYTNPSQLNDHIKTHDKNEIKNSDMKLYRCGRCEKSYKTMGNLQVHVYSHTGLKPHKCKYCSKAFTKYSALMTHLTIHTGLQKFLCAECGKGYTTALLLKRHKSSHSPRRPFACKFCPSSFAAPRDLTVHMRSHTGEKPYLCSTCGKSFRRVSHLNVHKRIHTGEKPYKCSHCEKCFAQSGDWKAHERIHTGVKPYSCTVCFKRFTQASALGAHMKKHDQVMFKCRFCPGQFLSPESLHKHNLTHIHHPDEDGLVLD